MDSWVKNNDATICPLKDSAALLSDADILIKLLDKPHSDQARLFSQIHSPLRGVTAECAVRAKRDTAGGAPGGGGGRLGQVCPLPGGAGK